MKSKHQIEELRSELHKEIQHPETTEERKNHLKGAVDAIDFILRD